MSADGKLSDVTRSQVRLSSKEDFDRVDRLRAESDAILVGVGTVLADDPSLTVKDETRALRQGNPTRVVADSSGRTPTDAAVLDDTAPTVVGVGNDAPSERVDALDEHADIVETEAERTDLNELLGSLEDRGVERLMVEGGGELVFSLLREGLVDELYVYVAPVFVGGRDAPTLVDGEGFVGDYVEATLEDVERVGEGVVVQYSL